MRPLQILIPVAAVTLWMAGCVGGGKTAGAKPVTTTVPRPDVRYRVTADVTPFYRNGPQQVNGPDLSLKKGTDILMVKRSFGYSQVKTIDTQLVGYISTEDVRPLTLPELNALTAAAASPPPVQTASGKKSSAIVGEYSLPPGASSQESLPQSENTPTPPPNNMFRY